MVSRDEGEDTHERRKQFRGNWWTRFIRYIKRKRYQRKRKKEEETPTDKAGRRTATATVLMAFFTLVLVVVGIGTYLILKNQLREMHEGGVDTHELAVAAKAGADAAGKQADAAGKQVTSTHDLAVAAKNQADAAKTQSDNAVKLAQAAIDQANNLAALERDTIAQNKVLSDQLDAMNRSMVLSEKQSGAALLASTTALLLDQRPWVEIEAISMADRWYWDLANKAYNLTIAFTLKNLGKTPAQGVWISPRVIPSAWGVDFKATQDAACDPKAGHLAGFVIFANKPITQSITLSLTQVDLDAYNLRSAYDGKPEHGVIECCGRHVNSGIVGCVGYYSGLSVSVLQTGFAFEIEAQ
jgi:hypothetical protein